MSKMSQDRTDYGESGETGERMPKGSTASDESGERRVPIMGGVGMGMADKTGREADHGKREGHVGEYNSGRKSESNFYKHKKADYK